MDKDEETIVNKLKERNISVVRPFREGSNAYSFEAYDNNLGRSVFVKTYFSDGDLISAFREPKNLVHCTEGSCANLPQIYDAHTMDINGEEYVFIYMKYIKGRSINDYLHSEGSFGQNDAIKLAIGILQGINNLHSFNFVHRDIKPGNVILDEMGTFPVPVITDFGSVKKIGDNTQDFVTASKHSVIYVPFEGWLEESKYYRQSDLYQVGCVLYELLNGHFNYEERHYVTVKARKDANEFLNKWNEMDGFDRGKIVNSCIQYYTKTEKLLEHGRNCYAYISPKLTRIISKATKWNYLERYQSASEFITALSSLAVPNWKKVGPNYSADGWKGYNWSLNLFTSKGSPVSYVLNKKRINGKKKICVNSYSRIIEAFRFVESQ